MAQRILVVDDEPNFVKMLDIRLKANGYEVFTALDGEEGIKKAKNHTPDLIIMDIMMPNMGGGDAVRLLQSDEKTNNIPVLFLTAVVDDSAEEHDQKVNIHSTFYPAMAKPFDPDKLLNKITELL